MRVFLSLAFVATFAALACATQVPIAAAASVFPPSGSHGITPQGPVWRFGDSNVDGGIQVNYQGRGPYVVNTLFRLRPHWVASCAGRHTLQEKVLVTRRGSRQPIISDGHAGETCDYTHHASGRATVGDYTMTVHDTWMAFVPGGRGTATLDAVANFSITLV